MKRPLLILSLLGCLMIPAPATAQMRTSQSQAVQPYQAQTVQPYQAHTVQPHQAQTIKRSQAQSVQPYKAQTVRRLSATERARMNRRPMSGYRPGKGGKAPQGLNEAQIKAYGVLNHNIGVWNSGQDFTMQPSQ